MSLFISRTLTWPPGQCRQEGSPSSVSSPWCVASAPAGNCRSPPRRGGFHGGGPDRHQTGGACGIWEQSVPSSGAGACAAAAKLSKSVAEAAEFFCSNFNRVSHTVSLASWVLESRVQTVQNAHGTVSPAATGCMLVSRVPAF